MPGHYRHRSRGQARGEEMKKQTAFLVLAAVLLSISAQPADSASRHGGSTAWRMADAARLGNVEQFKTAFQADQGKVRLVGLVSPT